MVCSEEAVMSQVIRCDVGPVCIADNLLSLNVPLTHCTMGSHAKPELPFKKVFILFCEVLIYLENRDYHTKPYKTAYKTLVWCSH